MNEPTHKIVNGIRVECTPDEINEIKAAWAKEDLAKQERMRLREQKKLAKESLKLKLNALGLTQQEIDLLRM